MESTLPLLYARWLKDLLGTDVPGEPRSTCSDCAMSRTPEVPSPKDRSFLPSVKCCGFTPILPNFLVGGILASVDPEFEEGRARFEREAPLRSVGPLGIAATDAYHLVYACKPFGKVEALVCPYFIPRDGGLCGIWQFRNAVCTTFFCTFERGQASYKFWQALREFLQRLEKALAHWCVDRMSLVIPEDPRDPREEIWGNWALHEREFYRGCYELVSQMSSLEVLDTGGQPARALLCELEQAHQELQKASIPECLIQGKYQTWALGNGFTRVWSFSNTDPLDLSDEICNVLDAFDGRPTAQALATIRKNTGLVFGTVLMQKLVDSRILIPPES